MGMIDSQKQFAEIMLARRKDLIKKINELKDQGHSNVSIARQLGIAESTVRDLLFF